MELRTPDFFPGGDRPFLEQIQAYNRRAQKGDDVFLQGAALARSVLSDDVLVELKRQTRILARADLRRLLGVLGFLAASLERQAEVAGGRGRTFAALPSLENILLRLSDLLGKAPRDDAESAWLERFAAPYLASSAEIAFADVVLDIEEVLHRLVADLKRLDGGHTTFLDTAQQLSSAAASLRGLVIKAADALQELIEECDFRAFCRSIEVGGQAHQGPDPVVTPEWNRMHTLVATYAGRRPAQLALQGFFMRVGASSLDRLNAGFALDSADSAAVDAANALTHTVSILETLMQSPVVSGSGKPAAASRPAQLNMNDQDYLAEGI